MGRIKIIRCACLVKKTSKCLGKDGDTTGLACGQTTMNSRQYILHATTCTNRHTCTCLGLPAVDIINVIRKGTAAMRLLASVNLATCYSVDVRSQVPSGIMVVLFWH